MYEAENKLPASIRHSISELDSIHERMSEYINAEAYGIRFEAKAVLQLLADVEQHLYALAGDIRKAERLTAIPDI